MDSGAVAIDGGIAIEQMYYGAGALPVSVTHGHDLKIKIRIIIDLLFNIVQDAFSRLGT